MTQSTYQTLAEPFRFEPERVKGSRFVASLAPADDESSALAHIAAVRAEFPRATHTVWAWRLGIDGKATRANDDGEPAGSAGRPVLAQIEGHEVTNVVVCVTRWFGGTKLGVGGLVRAYGGAAGMALDRAPLVTRDITVRLELRFPYECTNTVQAALHALQREPAEADYGVDVRIVVAVPLADLQNLTTTLTEQSGGRVLVKSPEP